MPDIGVDKKTIIEIAIKRTMHQQDADSRQKEKDGRINESFFFGDEQKQIAPDDRDAEHEVRFGVISQNAQGDAGQKAFVWKAREPRHKNAQKKKE